MKDQTQVMWSGSGRGRVVRYPTHRVSQEGRRPSIGVRWSEVDGEAFSASRGGWWDDVLKAGTSFRGEDMTSRP